MNVSKYAHEEWSADSFHDEEEVECFIRMCLPYIESGEYQVCFDGVQEEQVTEEGTKFIADTFFIGNGVLIYQDSQEDDETVENFTVDRMNVASIADKVYRMIEGNPTSRGDLLYFG